MEIICTMPFCTATSFLLFAWGGVVLYRSGFHFLRFDFFGLVFSGKADDPFVYEVLSQTDEKERKTFVFQKCNLGFL